MIICGIDAGIEYTKIVLLKDGMVVSKAVGVTGGARRAENIKLILDRALEKAGLSGSMPKTVVVTGKGKYNTGLDAVRITELVALDTAVRVNYPEATQAVCIGADEILAEVLSGDRIKEYTQNQKCSAGIGLFLEEAEELLGVSLSEITPAANSFLNDTCVSYAGMDTLEWLNKGVPAEKVAGAVVYFAVTRILGVLNDLTLPEPGNTVLTGGVCLNRSLTDCLMERGDGHFEVMEDPMFALAEGAAYYALRKA